MSRRERPGTTENRFDRALTTDVRSLLDAWVSEGTSDFREWTGLWRRRDASLLHHGPYRAGTTCPTRIEFTKALFRTVLELLLEDQMTSVNRQRRWWSGGIFALYTFYWTQPEPIDGIKERARAHIDDDSSPVDGTWRVPIRITPDILMALFQIRKDLVRAQAFDSLAVLTKLFQDDLALQYAAGTTFSNLQILTDGDYDYYRRPAEATAINARLASLARGVDAILSAPPVDDLPDDHIDDENNPQTTTSSGLLKRKRHDLASSSSSSDAAAAPPAAAAPGASSSKDDDDAVSQTDSVKAALAELENMVE